MPIRASNLAIGDRVYIDIDTVNKTQKNINIGKSLKIPILIGFRLLIIASFAIFLVHTSFFSSLVNIFLGEKWLLAPEIIKILSFGFAFQFSFAHIYMAFYSMYKYSFLLKWEIIRMLIFLSLLIFPILVGLKLSPLLLSRCISLTLIFSYVLLPISYFKLIKKDI